MAPAPLALTRLRDLDAIKVRSNKKYMFHNCLYVNNSTVVEFRGTPTIVIVLACMLVIIFIGLLFLPLILSKKKSRPNNTANVYSYVGQPQTRQPENSHENEGFEDDVQVENEYVNEKAQSTFSLDSDSNRLVDSMLNSKVPRISELNIQVMSDVLGKGRFGDILSGFIVEDGRRKRVAFKTLKGFF